MKSSAAAVLTLLATAQAGPTRLRRETALPIWHNNFPRLATNVTANVTASVAQLAALESASAALTGAQAAVDAALTDLGAGDATADTQDGNTEAGDTAGGSVVIVAQTLDGLLLPDGRIAADAALTDFDAAETSPFSPDNVKGDGLLFSELLLFPDVEASLFDAAGGTKALEITISDASIFVPGGAGGEPQVQFRRADLLPSAASVAEDSAVTGVRTLHFSVQQDPARPLALATNEYQLAFLETADFAARQFDVRVGTGTTSPSLTGGNIVVLGRSGDAIEELFVTPFDEAMQNFALTLDFDAK